MRFGLAKSSSGQTGQSDEIHSPDNCANSVKARAYAHKPPKTSFVPVDAPKLPAIKKASDAFRLHRILNMHADAILDRSNELSEIRGKLWCWKPDQALPDADDVDVTYYADELKRRAS